MKKKSGPGYEMKRARNRVSQITSSNLQQIANYERAVSLRTLKARLNQAFQDEEFDKDPWNKEVSLALTNHLIQNYNSYYSYIDTEYNCYGNVSI